MTAYCHNCQKEVEIETGYYAHSLLYREGSPVPCCVECGEEIDESDIKQEFEPEYFLT